MTIDEAIKIKERWKNALPSMMPEAFIEADNLSIEALKALRYMRNAEHPVPPTLLPLETKEYCKLCGATHTGIECPSRTGEK